LKVGFNPMFFYEFLPVFLDYGTLYIIYLFWIYIFNSDRYSHGVRGNFKKERVRGEEIEDLGDYLIGDLLAPHLEQLFPKYMEHLNLVLTEGAPSMFLVTIGDQSLITLTITSNYFALPYLDNEDLGFVFLSWFIKGIIHMTYLSFILVIFQNVDLDAK